MNLDEFLEAARRLRNLEIWDVEHPRVREWWGEFVRAPETFLVTCSPPVQAAIWAAAEHRREAAERTRETDTKPAAKRHRVGQQ